jgi:hypothetical protein
VVSAADPLRSLNRTMDKVQNCGSYFTVLSSQTYRSYVKLAFMEF